MNYLAFLTVVAAAAATTIAVAAVNGNDDVVRFKIDAPNHPLFNSLKGSGRAPQVNKYVFKNCGNNQTDLAKLGNIVLGPDPVHFPGPLTVAFNVNITTTLDAPLEGEVVLSTKTGSTWIKIPCIGVIGSCNYTDVCDLLKYAECPPPFVAQGIPCKCPFTQGNYALPTSKFEVQVPVFPNGEYHAVGKLSSNGQQVACVDIYVSFA